MKMCSWLAMSFVAVALAGCSNPGGNSGAAPADSAAPADAGTITFAASVAPIIQERCATCHIEDSKGGLSLDSLENALAGGKKGPDIIPGDSASSPLYLMVAGQAEKRMPPKGEPLSDEQIATIKQWIDAGAH